MRIKDIVIIGMLGAVLLAIQVVFAFLPNIELISLLIIIYTLILGRNTVFVIYVFVTLEGLFYGFGLWWINYLYVWMILFIVVRLFKKKSSPVFWALICGLFGIAFGALCAIPNLFLGGIPSAFAYWVYGIPFDIAHGISNFILTVVLFKPLYYIMHWLFRREEAFTLQ